MPRERKKLSESLKNSIINALISKTDSKSDDNYMRQVKAIEHVFIAIESNEPLSLSLIKELHEILCPPPIYSAFAAPEQNLDVLIPGEFRNIPVISNISLADDEVDPITKAGIAEILSIIESETDFDQYKGTWLGPINKAANGFCEQGTIRNDNLSQRLSELSRQELIDEIHLDAQRRAYAILFPTKNKASPDIQSYQEFCLNKLINKCNQIILTNSSKNYNEIIKIIVKFIKSCIRLHPFRDLNHRTFALCIFNFLLLKNNIGYCSLKNRRIFSKLGLDETLESVAQQLQSVNPEEIQVISDPFDSRKSYTSDNCLLQDTKVAKDLLIKTALDELNNLLSDRQENNLIRNKILEIFNIVCKQRSQFSAFFGGTYSVHTKSAQNIIKELIMDPKLYKILISSDEEQIPSEKERTILLTNYVYQEVILGNNSTKSAVPQV